MKTVLDGKIYLLRFTTKRNSKKIVVGNIYRVPNELSENLQISVTLEILQTMRSHVYIGGDFNIDLLKINQKHHYNAFYENLVTAGYLLLSPFQRG